MNNKGLTDKEAALLAAARRELAKPPAAPAVARVPVPGVAAPQYAAPSRGASVDSSAAAPLSVKTIPAAHAVSVTSPAKPDIATRMAMLVEAERLANQDRKRRIKRNYLILIAAVIVPAFLYVIIGLVKLLAR